MAIDQFGNVIPAPNPAIAPRGYPYPAGDANGPFNPNDPGQPRGYGYADGRGVLNRVENTGGGTMAQAIIDAVDVIDKAMGEMSAASQGQVISPVGAATKTAHVISPGALQAADDKIRGATARLKDAVGNYNGRSAGDPFWHNVAPAAGTPRQALNPAGSPVFNRVTGTPGTVDPTKAASARAQAQALTGPKAKVA